MEPAAPALAIMLERVVDGDRNQRIREQMNALSSVARVFTEAKNMEGILQDMANAINTATGFLASVDVLDDAGHIVMRSTGASRYAETPLYDLWIKMTQAPDYVRALILEDREPVLLPDLHHDTRISEEAREFYRRASIVSGATFPLLVQNRVIGLMRVGSLKPTTFPPAVAALLGELAVQAAIVVNAVQLHTEQARAQDALRTSEQRFRSLVQNASDLITVMAADTTITYQSPSAMRLLGLDGQDLVGTKLSDLLHPDDLGRMLRFFEDTMSMPGTMGTVEARLRHSDGSWRHVEIRGTDQRQDPAVAGFIINTRDVTERKGLEEQLRHQAFHDPLTKLANRARFTDRLEHALARASRTSNGLAVLFMDLDNFKSVNDSFGHRVGDEVLVEIGRRIEGCLRAGDTCARFGGDEFAILLEDVDGIQGVAHLAARIAQSLEAPHSKGAGEVVVSASLGIAITDEQPISADDLLRKADLAMYAAKERGKARVEIYEQDMQVSVAERLELLVGLQKALDRGEFVVHYQPAVALRSGRLVGFEALVRWTHPRLGLLYPEQFIPLAEESGTIITLGRWVLSQACHQAKEWQTKYSTDPALAISVNVSVRQLQQTTFVSDVLAVLRATQLDPRALVLEITENGMMQDISSTVASLSEIKKHGVRVAIDDFGTGYSSLSYLNKLPLDILKIDKSFIERSNEQAQLTRAIVELGKSLGLTVVAEGIESREQLTHLRALNCDVGQGFLFAKPLDPAEVQCFLERNIGLLAA